MNSVRRVLYNDTHIHNSNCSSYHRLTLTPDKYKKKKQFKTIRIKKKTKIVYMKIYLKRYIQVYEKIIILKHIKDAIKIFFKQRNNSIQ